ncbi:hypothetical protein M422DRAFT_51619 [Sphaerobolus stellatus SS14]|uniref:Uncharacterized protein n=1 Tax=Sphaerobolus stellatus (strain SS14) TaxID=990650 RepID=A0A0C9V0D7_SPHS4|nr:hypothetical protein M422DRAFT_51619 [Sphaerobolus stellatus SS14]
MSLFQQTFPQKLSLGKYYDGLEHSHKLSMADVDRQSCSVKLTLYPKPVAISVTESNDDSDEEMNPNQSKKHMKRTFNAPKNKRRKNDVTADSGGEASDQSKAPPQLPTTGCMTRGRTAPQKASCESLHQFLLIIILKLY